MMLPTDPVLVSVIIPTHNRARLLSQTLAAVARQTDCPGRVEVLVVDDGSTDGTAGTVQGVAGLDLKYVSQPKLGATAARNLGAAQASGEYLAFIDDDVEPRPGALAALIETLREVSGSVVVGALLADERLESTGGLELTAGPLPADDVSAIPATRCFTGLLAIRRADFEALGRFEDPTGGWPNWDDVAFGYRAQRAGHRLLHNRKAEAFHHDPAATDLEAAADRWYRASQSAVRLFQKYPDLYDALPMFRDKTPIRLGRDTAPLVLRKLARLVASSGPVLEGLLALHRLIKSRRLAPQVHARIRRWIIGGYVRRGLHQGLKLYGALPE